MKLENSKLMLVGGAGLVGSHLTDLLLREEVSEIVIYDNFKRGTYANLKGALRDPRVKVIEADISDASQLQDAMEGMDGVFLLAALWLLQCAEDPASGLQVNINGNFNVIETARRVGIKRIVFSSSASVYGNALVQPMPENHELNNRTFYGATKVALEQMLRSYFEMYQLPYVALRYFNIYGPRQDYKNAYVSVIMKVLDKIDRGESPVIFGDGSQAYDFIYVKDVAEANLRAMSAEICDESFNICTGKKTSINELVKLILEITKSTIQPEYKPAGQVFVSDRVGDPQKAAKLLGFKPKTSLTNGLIELIEWRAAAQREGALTLSQ